MISNLITLVKKCLCLVLLAGVTSCLAQPVDPKRLSDGTRLIEVTAWQWGFDPSFVTAKVGDTIRLRVSSLDVAHTLTCKDLNIDLPIPPRGATPVDFEFTVQKAGDFIFVCEADCGPGRSRQKIRLLVTQ